MRPSHLIVTAAAALVVACKETRRPSPSGAVPPLGGVEATRSAVPSGGSASDDSASLGTGSPQTQPSGFGDRTPALTDSAFIFRVHAELAALDTTITLSDWRAKHPTDTVVLFSHGLKDHSDEEWCARSTPSGAAGGTPFVRHAYFYPASPSAELQLPPASTDLAASCRLGAIWIESPLSGDAAHDIRAQNLIVGLRQWYGQETAMDRDLSFWGVAYWRPVAQWRSGGVTVVAALDRGGPVGYEKTPTLRAIAFARPSTLGYGIPENKYAVATPLSIVMLAERALRLARAEPAESAPMLELLRESIEETERDRAAWLAWRERARTVLRDWVTAAHRRTPSERAAALLVADVAMSLRGLGNIVAHDSTARRVLGALGAEFTYSQQWDTWLYTHSWRRTAQGLVPSGPVADLALLWQLEYGFDDAGTCSAGEDEFHRVIAEGEPLVSRLQEPSDRAEVHYLLGIAHADIVGLADGISEYASQDYSGEATAARARGIHHMRQAVSLDPGAPNARHAWVTAWRLQAGLPPLSVRFFCFVD